MFHAAQIHNRHDRVLLSEGNLHCQAGRALKGHKNAKDFGNLCLAAQLLPGPFPQLTLQTFQTCTDSSGLSQG